MQPGLYMYIWIIQLLIISYCPDSYPPGHSWQHHVSKLAMQIDLNWFIFKVNWCEAIEIHVRALALATAILWYCIPIQMYMEDIMVWSFLHFSTQFDVVTIPKCCGYSEKPIVNTLPGCTSYVMRCSLTVVIFSWCCAPPPPHQRKKKKIPEVLKQIYLSTPLTPVSIGEVFVKNPCSIDLGRSWNTFVICVRTSNLLFKRSR